MLSDRDITLMESFGSETLAKTKVAAAMTPIPYMVTPCTELRDVVVEMERRRYGSALVANGRRVMGIFTVNDLLRAVVSSLNDP